MSSGDVEMDVDFTVLRTTLKRVNPEAEKAVRKALGDLGTEGKNLLKSKVPSKSGRMKRSIGKGTSFTAKKSQVYVTSKKRYTFIVNYGRKKYRPFPARRYVQNTMLVLEPMARVELEKAKTMALRAFE